LLMPVHNRIDAFQAAEHLRQPLIDGCELLH
jgi:hypothetical protein